MNKYYEHFLNSKGNRDTVFNDILSRFQNKPIVILEIGAARSLDFYNRMSDGWSSLHFCRYIKENGGELHIVDIDDTAIENCNILTEGFNPVIKKANILSERLFNIDLVYLDGPDDPEESLKLFEKCLEPDCPILIDDFHTKGTKISEKYPYYEEFGWRGAGHKMAYYNKHTQKETKLLDPIQ